MKDTYLFILILVLLFIFIYVYCNINIETFNICTGNLTDKEFLEHMIPHHQVAIDISKMLQKKTKWPLMQEILRKIIWVQQYEIILMKEALSKLPENDMSSSTKMNKIYIKTIGDLTKPNKLGLTHTECDPHFFDPKKHMKHMQHMKLDDKMYIKHMIPHHQVAVDMSKKLLQNTNNDFMIYLAYRIIHSQQAEIVYLNDILHNLNSKNKYYYESSHIL